MIKLALRTILLSLTHRKVEESQSKEVTSYLIIFADFVLQIKEDQRISM